MPRIRPGCVQRGGVPRPTRGYPQSSRRVASQHVEGTGCTAARGAGRLKRPRCCGGRWARRPARAACIPGPARRARPVRRACAGSLATTPTPSACGCIAAQRNGRNASAHPPPRFKARGRALRLPCSLPPTGATWLRAGAGALGTRFRPASAFLRRPRQRPGAVARAARMTVHPEPRCIAMAANGSRMETAAGYRPSLRADPRCRTALSRRRRCLSGASPPHAHPSALRTRRAGPR